MFLFTGINPRWQLFPWLPAGLHVMYSAGGMWDNERGEWRSRPFPRLAGMRWLDCGGFTLLNSYGDYPFSVAAYANLVARLKPTFYATMDYPCEPEINRTLTLTDNRTRIEATVENAARLLAMESMIGVGTAVPVIQGDTLAEYLYCIELYAQRGLIRPYMAVGSMCKRSNDKQILALLPAIYQAATAVGVERLHLFGLKLSRMLRPLDGLIWSRDSAAVLFAQNKFMRGKFSGRSWAKSKGDKKAAFGYFWDSAHEDSLLYSAIQPGVCPDCGGMDGCSPCEEFDLWGCPDCGFSWDGQQPILAA